MVLEHREQLILSEPDPDTTKSVHSFQNPTYAKKIKDHIDDYLNNEGGHQ